MFTKGLHEGEEGFTLIELLIVVAILGVLAAVIVPNLASFLGSGDVAAANTEVANVESAALAYHADHDGVWPTDSDDLVADYLSAATKYAVYDIGASSFGKITGVNEKAAADTIAWVDADHEWQKDESSAPAPDPLEPAPIQPVPVAPGIGCSGPVPIR
jgi:type IV pilus assembly protein PilA